VSDWIKTGNNYADSILMDRYMNDPIMIALVDYLEFKGILNQDEFAQFVNEHCRADVVTREKLQSEP